MADGNRAGDAGGHRLTLVLGGGLATVLLAAVGATAGWVLAGADDDRSAVVAGASASPTARSVTTSPVRGSTAPATPTRPAATGPTVPDLIGRDYEDAQDELEERGLRWRLVFQGGAGKEVARTSPAKGTTVAPGRTVTLYVSGPPPVVQVPDVVDDDCAEAVEELTDDGFRVVPTQGRRGLVLKQEPAGGSQARWGDPIALWCGEPSGSPSPNE